MIIIRTERLLLREATANDSEFILNLVNQPAWYKFIDKHDIDSISKASEYIQQRMLAMYQEHGFGLWIVEIPDTSTPVGICGLLKRDSLDNVDIGFAFLESFLRSGVCLRSVSGHAKLCL